MKKTIAAFILGGLITAGAYGLAYGLPITSAAEKAAPEKMPDQCTEMMSNPDAQNMMNSMMPADKAADPKAAEDMAKQCTDMMKDPNMQNMMKSIHSDGAGDMNHSAHHQ